MVYNRQVLALWRQGSVLVLLCEQAVNEAAAATLDTLAGQG